MFLAGMIFFSGVRILPKGCHKWGGAINRNRYVHSINSSSLYVLTVLSVLIVVVYMC